MSHSQCRCFNVYQLAAQQRSYLAFELKPFSSKKREVVPITSVLTSRAACEGVMESEDLSGLAIVRYQQPYTVQNPGTPASLMAKRSYQNQRVYQACSMVKGLITKQFQLHRARGQPPFSRRYVWLLRVKFP